MRIRPRLYAAAICWAISTFFYLPTHAADLGRVQLSQEGKTISIDLTLSEPSPSSVILSSDRLRTVILLPDVNRIPPLPILDAESVGLTFGMIERQSGGQIGAKISLIASEPLSLLAPVASSDPKTIRLQFSLGLQRHERAPVQKPPRLAVTGFGATALALPKPPAPGKAGAAPPMATAPATTPKATGIGKGPALPSGLSPADPLARAAASGDVDAMIDIGNQCLTASPPDFVAARAWFNLAADRGSAVGAYNIAQMYRRGVMGAVDDVQAAKWYELAAKAKFAPAEYNLALMLLEGRGINQDNNRGRNLLELAQSHGYTRAADVLRDLKDEKQVSRTAAKPKQ